MLSPSSYKFACINLITYTLYIPIGLGLWLVDLLSPTVISCHISLPSYMMLRLACVFVGVFGLPSLMM
jgi:hypothetical protein